MPQKYDEQQQKLYDIYRALTYTKLQKALDTTKSVTKVVHSEHMVMMLKRCQEWLQGEVVKVGHSKQIIENAANEAAKAFLENNHIRLKQKRGIEALLDGVTVRTGRFPFNKTGRYNSPNPEIQSIPLSSRK